MHTCDNRRCCNPAHLRIGTQQDNIDDMIQKGRAAPSEAKRRLGSAHGRAKLAEADVIEIRRLASSVNGSQRDQDSGRFKRTSVSELAERYGVSKGLISQILKRRIWTHV